ncbi:BAP31-like protein [Mya arenaria]|uniref:Endoplasmic reticulum transmembrane protein n=1 Tax=Mya arenaria TaxID=6604 RepID=A0ABY7FXD5_MYAAR|nr:BAP31-like protein [Mya arenaria]
MALQWYLIAVFLYGEIGVITLLLLPFISPARWQSIFRSSLVQKCARLSNISFNVFIAILLVMVMELEEKQTDFDALKKQSESTNKEYNRLLNEYSKARVKIEELTGVSKT